MCIYTTTFSNIDRGPLNFTSSVISYSYQTGRQSYLDNWNGNQLTLVIRNNAQQADNFLINDRISISTLPNYFWVSSISYNDALGTNGTAGSGSASTATIICDDWLAKVGRIQVNDFALTQTDTISQLTQFNSILTANGLAIDTTAGAGSSVASAATYSGTILNRINLNMTTEKGQIKLLLNKAYLLPRSAITANFSTPVISSKSEGVGTILYQGFQRITLGQNFVNAMTVQPEGLADQTAQYTPSVNTYGIKSGTLTTVDATTGQALDLAYWLSNVQAYPMSLRFAVEVSDTGNGSSEFASWLSNMNQQNYWGLVLLYYVPGSAAQVNMPVVFEGMDIHGFPDRTETTAYFSPYDFYNYFILNSTVQGVLDDDRLGF